MSVQDAPAAQDPRERLREAFDTRPYHEHLGLELVEVTAETLSAQVRRKPELVGRRGKEALHGGAIASLVDAVGAFHAVLAARRRSETTDRPDEERARAYRVVTISLNLDFLRPLTAEAFVATSVVAYCGASLVRIRIDVHDDRGAAVAIASANFSY